MRKDGQTSATSSSTPSERSPSDSLRDGKYFPTIDRITPDTQETYVFAVNL